MENLRKLAGNVYKEDVRHNWCWLFLIFLAASILIPEGMKGVNNMKRMQKAAAILWFAGLLCLLSAILTNWNDKVFLPLALTFIMAANYSGIACEKLKQGKAMNEQNRKRTAMQ